MYQGQELRCWYRKQTQQQKKVKQNPTRMSDEEYEYDYGSDAEYDYGSDQEMNEDNGNSELIEIENAFYGMTKLLSSQSLMHDLQ